MSSKGIKYDTGKVRVGEFVKDFGIVLTELARIWEFGADKYGIGNWKLVDNGEVRFTNAMFRHILKEDEKVFDDETRILHASHVAFNALMRLYFILEERSYDVTEQGQ